MPFAADDCRAGTTLHRRVRETAPRDDKKTNISDLTNGQMGTRSKWRGFTVSTEHPSESAVAPIRRFREWSYDALLLLGAVGARLVQKPSAFAPHCKP
jgi:hypothetical protein